MNNNLPWLNPARTAKRILVIDGAMGAKNKSSSATDYADKHG